MKKTSPALLLLAFFLVSCTSAIGRRHREVPAEWPNVNFREKPAPSRVLSLCEAVEILEPEVFAHVRVRAVLMHPAEGRSFLYDPNCRSRHPTTAVDFGNLKSPEVIRLLETLERTRNVIVDIEGRIYGPRKLSTDAATSEPVRRIASRYDEYLTLLVVSRVREAEPVGAEMPPSRWSEEEARRLDAKFYETEK